MAEMLEDVGMLSGWLSWLLRVVGWSVLLGGLLVGCAAKGSVCLDWDMALAEDVRLVEDAGTD